MYNSVGLTQAEVLTVSACSGSGGLRVTRLTVELACLILVEPNLTLSTSVGGLGVVLALWAGHC